MTEKKYCSSCQVLKAMDQLQKVETSSKIKRWICLACLDRKGTGWYGKKAAERIKSA